MILYKERMVWWFIDLLSNDVTRYIQNGYCNWYRWKDMSLEIAYVSHLGTPNDIVVQWLYLCLFWGSWRIRRSIQKIHMFFPTSQYNTSLSCWKPTTWIFGFGGKSWTDVSSFQNKFQHPKIFAFLKFEELGHLVNLTKTFKGQVWMHPKRFDGSTRFNELDNFDQGMWW